MNEQVSTAVIQQLSSSGVEPNIIQLLEMLPPRIRGQASLNGVLMAMDPLLSMLYSKSWVDANGTTVQALRDAYKGLEDELSDFPQELRGLSASKLISRLSPLVHTLRDMAYYQERQRAMQQDGRTPIGEGDGSSASNVEPDRG